MEFQKIGVELQLFTNSLGKVLEDDVLEIGFDIHANAVPVFEGKFEIEKLEGVVKSLLKIGLVAIGH